MYWQFIVSTLIFSVISYLIGSISWAIVISKLLKKEDIRLKGSRNAGATNVTRNYGKKIGLLVFLLDMCKPIKGVLAAYLVMTFSKIELFSNMSLQTIGFFALIGHIFPIFFKFKGGKGAATFVGYIISMQWLLFFIGFITFWIITLKWRKVSLSSIICPLIVIIFQIIFNFIPHLDETWSNPMMQKPNWWTNTIFLTISWIIILIKHKENIKRLINKTEITIDKDIKKAK